MKKNLFLFLSFATILLAWCNSNKQIDSNTWISNDWLSINQVLEEQMNDSPYIIGLQDFVSYDENLLENNKSFSSNTSLQVKFDKESSLIWWIEFSQKIFSEQLGKESRDINFNMETIKSDNLPFNTSWSITLLRNDGELYANLHNFGVYMWEENGEEDMTAKMYSLIWNMIKDKWVDLEVNNGWIISISEKDDIQSILYSIKSILKEDISQNSSDTLAMFSELLDIINSYIDLWLSINNSEIKSLDINYYETNDWNIQKEIIVSFQWEEHWSSFDMAIVISKEKLQIHIYNIEWEDRDFKLSLENNKGTQYKAEVNLLQNQENMISINWIIDFDNSIDFNLNFVGFIAWYDLSGVINWNVDRSESNDILPEISWDVISFNEILSSL